MLGDGVGESTTSGECAGMVGGEEHDDVEGRIGGSEHYSWAEIPMR